MPLSMLASSSTTAIIFGRVGINLPGLARITACWIAGEPVATINHYPTILSTGSPVPEYNRILRNALWPVSKSLAGEAAPSTGNWRSATDRSKHHKGGISRLAIVTGRRGQYAEAFGDQHELGKRLNLALLHDLLPMRLDGSFGNIQFVGNLLVELAANHQGEDLSFSWGES